MFKELLHKGLGLISKADHDKKFDIHLVRVTRDSRTMYPRVEATDLVRILRVDLKSRSEVEEFFIDNRLLPALSEADSITQDKRVLTATTGQECLMVETKTEANWPNFDRILPQKPTAHRIELNGKLLIELLMVVDAYNDDPNRIITLEIHRGDLVVKAGKEVSVTAMQARIERQKESD